MKLSLSFHFKGSRPFTDIREHKSKSLHDRKRELEHRLGRWRDCTAQKFFYVIEIADLRHDMLGASAASLVVLSLTVCASRTNLHFTFGFPRGKIAKPAKF